jgi:hypothetical protein
MKYNAAQTACETFHMESRRLHRKHWWAAIAGFTTSLQMV